MNSLAFKNSILLFALLMYSGLSNYTKGQIKANNPSYETLGGADNLPIYVFCDALNKGVGSLSFGLESDSSYSYKWSIYDSLNSSYTDLGLYDFRINKLKNGKYKVVATSGSDVMVAEAWVFNNTSTSLVNLSLDEKTCDFLSFKINFSPWTIPINATNKPVKTKGDYSIDLFRNDTSVKKIDLDYHSNGLLYIQDESAFENKSDFIVKVSQFGCLLPDSKSIVSETSKIEPEFTYNPGPAEAPMEVEFSHVSKKIDTYEWSLFKENKVLKQNEDDGITDIADNLLDNGLSDEANFIFVYDKPGEYKVKFKATTKVDDLVCEYVCELDGTGNKKYIKVDSSLVELPNVFTPNDDGSNDKFCVQAKSLSKFKATIFNRWGNVMYTWTNEDECWDGKTGGKLASAGTYFIVVTAKGRESDDKSTYTKKQSFMLVR